MPEIQELLQQIQELEIKVNQKNTEVQDLIMKLNEFELTLKNHKHQGGETYPILMRDLKGEIATVSTAPSAAPGTKLNEQIKIYVSGATKRLYIYDFVNNAWRYVALT